MTWLDALGWIGSVAGHPATISDNRYRRCLSWTQPAGLVHGVCSETSNHVYLDANELIKIARSIK